MTTPTLVFGLLLATALAAAYHFILGRSLRQLAWLWPASIVGFAVGQLVAPLIPVHLPQLGVLHLVEGIGASLVSMTIVRSIRL